MADIQLRVFGYIGALLATSTAGTLVVDLKPQRKMILLRIQIILLLFIVLCALARFVWVNLVILLPSRRTNSKTLLAIHWLSYVVFVTFSALACFSILIARFFVGMEPYFITKLAFTCLGLLVLIFCNLCVLSGVFVLLRLSRCSLPNADRWKTIIATALSLFLCIYGLTSASKGPDIKGVTIPLAKLPLSLDGTRIIQLSDIHLGAMVGNADLDRVASMVSIMKPDIIVITGDLVDSSVEKLKKVVLPLKKLRSKYGAFFVTGI